MDTMDMDDFCDVIPTEAQREAAEDLADCIWTPFQELPPWERLPCVIPWHMGSWQPAQS